MSSRRSRSANPRRSDKFAYVFGSSTPRDLSYLDLIPWKYRVYDVPLSSRMSRRDMDAMRHDWRQTSPMRTARSPSQKRNGMPFGFGSATPREFSYLETLDPEWRVYDVKLIPVNGDRRSKTTSFSSAGSAGPVVRRSSSLNLVGTHNGGGGESSREGSVRMTQSAATSVPFSKRTGSTRRCPATKSSVASKRVRDRSQKSLPRTPQQPAIPNGTAKESTPKASKPVIKEKRKIEAAAPPRRISTEGVEIDSAISSHRTYASEEDNVESTTDRHEKLKSEADAVGKVEEIPSGTNGLAPQTSTTKTEVVEKHTEEVGKVPSEPQVSPTPTPESPEPELMIRKVEITHTEVTTSIPVEHQPEEVEHHIHVATPPSVSPTPSPQPLVVKEDEMIVESPAESPVVHTVESESPVEEIHSSISPTPSPSEKQIVEERIVADRPDIVIDTDAVDLPTGMKLSHSPLEHKGSDDELSDVENGRKAEGLSYRAEHSDLDVDISPRNVVELELEEKSDAEQIHLTTSCAPPTGEPTDVQSEVLHEDQRRSPSPPHTHLDQLKYVEDLHDHHVVKRSSPSPPPSHVEEHKEAEDVHIVDADQLESASPQPTHVEELKVVEDLHEDRHVEEFKSPSPSAHVDENKDIEDVHIVAEVPLKSPSPLPTHVEELKVVEDLHEDRHVDEFKSPSPSTHVEEHKDTEDVHVVDEVQLKSPSPLPTHMDEQKVVEDLHEDQHVVQRKSPSPPPSHVDQPSDTEDVNMAERPSSIPHSSPQPIELKIESPVFEAVVVQPAQQENISIGRNEVEITFNDDVNTGPVEIEEEIPAAVDIGHLQGVATPKSRSSRGSDDYAGDFEPKFSDEEAANADLNEEDEVVSHSDESQRLSVSSLQSGANSDVGEPTAKVISVDEPVELSEQKQLDIDTFESEIPSPTQLLPTEDFSRSPVATVESHLKEDPMVTSYHQDISDKISSPFGDQHDQEVLVAETPTDEDVVDVHPAIDEGVERLLVIGQEIHYRFDSPVVQPSQPSPTADDSADVQVVSDEEEIRLVHHMPLGPPISLDFDPDGLCSLPTPTTEEEDGSHQEEFQPESSPTPKANVQPPSHQSILEDLVPLAIHSIVSPTDHYGGDKSSSPEQTAADTADMEVEENVGQQQRLFRDFPSSPASVGVTLDTLMPQSHYDHEEEFSHIEVVRSGQVSPVEEEDQIDPNGNQLDVDHHPQSHTDTVDVREILEVKIVQQQHNQQWNDSGSETDEVRRIMGGNSDEEMESPNDVVNTEQHHKEQSVVDGNLPGDIPAVSFSMTNNEGVAEAVHKEQL